MGARQGRKSAAGVDRARIVQTYQVIIQCSPYAPVVKISSKIGLWPI